MTVEALPLFPDRGHASRFAPSEDVCESRHGGNPESAAAHERAKGRKAALHAAILIYVRELGPATCYEVEIGLGIPHQTCSARVSELKKDGRLTPTGEKRRTNSGSFAAVLKVTA